jgi:glycerol uptake facilitator protein
MMNSYAYKCINILYLTGCIRRVKKKSPSTETFAAPRRALYRGKSLLHYSRFESPNPLGERVDHKPTLAAELIAEFLGTFVLILFGTGVVAMVGLFPSDAGASAHGGYTNITIGWGLAVTLGIYVAGKVSGGHLNPAVTLALAVFRGFPWYKVIPYAIVQTSGAFLAAALVYKNYLPAFHRFDPQLEKTAGIFTTFPAFPAWPQAGFLDQVIGTALLLLMVLAVTDELNIPPGANLAPLMIGLIVVAIGMSFGGMHGYAINPARDFGPRLFTAIAGFKNNGLTDGPRVWWVPVFAPLIGGLIGAAVYDFGIRRFLRRMNPQSTSAGK